MRALRAHLNLSFILYTLFTILAYSSPFDNPLRVTFHVFPYFTAKKAAYLIANRFLYYIPYYIYALYTRFIYALYTYPHVPFLQYGKRATRLSLFEKLRLFHRLI